MPTISAQRPFGVDYFQHLFQPLSNFDQNFQKTDRNERALSSAEGRDHAATLVQPSNGCLASAE